jgi:hypothetical protein
MNWQEFVELFATKSTRVELINQAAGGFFRIVQDTLLESILLHIARLTDPPQSTGRKDRANLTIQNLPALVGHAETKAKVQELVAVAMEDARFCRDWRNRHIAHRDLNLALGASAVPLPEASKKHVDDALGSLARVLNAIDGHYNNSETSYHMAAVRHGAVNLLQVVVRGLKAQEERKQRLLRGEFSPDDLRGI